MTRLANVTVLFIVILAVSSVPVSWGHAGDVGQSSPSAVVRSTDPAAVTRSVRLAAVTKGPQRIVVILVEFPDAIHTTSADKVRGIMNDMDTFYREASYGLAWIVSTVIDKWYRVETPLSRLDIQQWDYNEADMARFEREAVKAADNEVNFRDYDYVYIVAAGRVWGHAKCHLIAPTNDGINGFKGVVVNEQKKVDVYSHELAHLLPSDYEPFGGCGLPDLYSYSASLRGEDSSKWIGPWDLMDDGLAFSAWSKISLGWLTPERVRLTSESSFPINLQPLENNDGIRAIVVPITDETSYVVEVRRQIGHDKTLPATGLLVYFVDLGKESGYGLLKVMDAKPETKTLEDSPFERGDTFDDDRNDVHIRVALAEELGFMVIVSAIRNPDTDRDGLRDEEELEEYGTNPTNPDTDNDGLLDGEEIQFGTDPLKPDIDDDGLKDGKEIQLGTNPKNVDTDGDGLKDGEEVNKYTTNPLKADTDNDGLIDSVEVKSGTNPLKPDTDGDFWRDNIDIAPTNPLVPDAIAVMVLVLMALTLAIASTQPGKKHPSAHAAIYPPSPVPAWITVATEHTGVTGQFCIECGLPVPVGSRFCHRCGAEQEKVRH